MSETFMRTSKTSAEAWGRSGWLNLRVGRFPIPFGEEYQRRNMLDNPLISHSVGDIWGIDEGVEVFGAVDRFSYVLAVQNGGHKTLRDFDADKAVVARVGYDPTAWLHLSVSAMRTGDLTVVGDAFSEVWIGNGFFRAPRAGGDDDDLFGQPVSTRCGGEMDRGQLAGRLRAGSV